MLPLSALGDTPDYIIGGLRDWRPWAGPDGKGFFSGKGGDRCLSPASFHQKNLFKAALTQLKASHRPFKQSHCSGHLASDVPTRDLIGKVHSGDCLSCRARLDGQRCLRWATPTGRRAKRGLFKPSGLREPVYGDWRQRDCAFDQVRLLEYVELVWPGHGDW